MTLDDFDTAVKGTASGHMLGEDAAREVAEKGIGGALTDAAQKAGEAVGSFELPSLKIPTAAYVIVGLVGVGFIALPLAYVFLMVKVGKAAAKGAVAAAPVVAKVGPAVLPFVPELAPVVAGAGVINAWKNGQDQGEVNQHVSALLGSVMTPKSGGVTTVPYSQSPSPAAKALLLAQHAAAEPPKGPTDAALRLVELLGAHRAGEVLYGGGAPSGVPSSSGVRTIPDGRPAAPSVTSSALARSMAQSAQASRTLVSVKR